MKITWKTAASVLFSILGTIGWCYIGGWMVLTRPLKGVFTAHAAGCLSIGKIFFAGVQGFVYLSVAGAVWCIGYILSNHFREGES